MTVSDHDPNLLVLGFPEYEQPTQTLAEALGTNFRIVDLHQFPDGESLVRLPESVPNHLILIRSLDRPNQKLIELMLTGETARELGARNIVLVAPYLCYMRQDKAFHPGESVSQRIVGALIGKLFDAMITVDPHLHRTHSLSNAVPNTMVDVIAAAPLLNKFLAERLPNAFLLGPDEESTQWVSELAKLQNLDYAIATKTRLGDREVQIALPDINLHGRVVVIVDDMASTGFTLAAAAEKARIAGAKAIYAFVTHALFVEGAITRIQKAGIEEIWSTDSIPHASNAVSLLPLLVHSVKKILK